MDEASFELQPVTGACGGCEEEKPSRIAVKTGVSSSPSRRLLKYTLPLPLLLVVLFGGLCLLCDGRHEALDDLGLWISPQLKYVRGPPPV